MKNDYEKYMKEIIEIKEKTCSEPWLYLYPQAE